MACSALRLYLEIAGENRSRRDARDFDWQGLVFSFNPRDLRRVIEPRSIINGPR
jgi:hypothetical protein